VKRRVEPAGASGGWPFEFGAQFRRGVGPGFRVARPPRSAARWGALHLLRHEPPDITVANRARRPVWSFWTTGSAQRRRPARGRRASSAGLRSAGKLCGPAARCALSGGGAKGPGDHRRPGPTGRRSARRVRQRSTAGFQRPLTDPSATASRAVMQRRRRVTLCSMLRSSCSGEPHWPRWRGLAPRSG
jgi:hypothetical protein